MGTAFTRRPPTGWRSPGAWRDRRPRRSRSDRATPTPRCCSSAIPAWARRGWPTAWSTICSARAPRPTAPGRPICPCRTRRAPRTIEREIWLWDFAGQADYRLIHQLFMDETALAVLVFNPQSENPFEGLGQWDRDLQRAARGKFKKLLVAGRCDRGGLMVSRAEPGRVLQGARLRRLPRDQRQDRARAATSSARRSCGTSTGRRSPGSPRRRSSSGSRRRSSSSGTRAGSCCGWPSSSSSSSCGCPARAFSPERAAGRGRPAGRPRRRLEAGVRRLRAAPARADQRLRRGRDPQGPRPHRGDRLHLRGGRAGREARLPGHEAAAPDEEPIVLRAMHQTLVDHGLCLREHTGEGPLLIFPSYFKRERPELDEHPARAGDLPVQRAARRDLRHAGRPAASHRGVREGPALAVRGRLQDAGGQAARAEDDEASRRARPRWRSISSPGSPTRPR